MIKPNWWLGALLLMGCQITTERADVNPVIRDASDSALCYSLIDDQFQLNQQSVLRELRERKIDSCLSAIVENECPQHMISRDKCIEEANVRVTSKLKSSQSSIGTEFLIKGLQIGVGILPF